MDRIRASLILAALLSAARVRAAAPPPGSPLADRAHPRLLIIKDGYSGIGVTVSEMKKRLADHYLSNGDLQYFVDRANEDYALELHAKSTTTLSQGESAALVWSGQNMAFLALIDVKGSFPAITGARTREEYAQRAKEHALRIADYVETGWEGVGHYNYLEPLSTIPTAIIYDWTAAASPGLWTDEEKRVLAQAYIDARGDIRPMNSCTENRYMQSNRLVAGWPGSLALLGDSIPGSTAEGKPYEAEVQRLYDELIGELEGNMLPCLRFFYENGASPNWGGNYIQDNYKGYAFLLGPLSTAHARSYFDEPFLKRFPVWVLANIRPYRENGDPWMLTAQDSMGLRFTLKQFFHIHANLLAIMNHQAESDRDAAGLTKWLLQYTGPEAEKRPNARYGWLWYHFLWGSQHWESESALPTKSPASVPHVVQDSMYHGQGQYTFRTGYDLDGQADTKINFYAPRNIGSIGGHGSKTAASFVIEKHGMLVPQVSPQKGCGEIPPEHCDASQLFGWHTNYAAIGVLHAGEEGPDGNNDMDYVYQNDPAISPFCKGENCGVGFRLAERINQPGYDFVSYDYSRAWKPTKVSHSSRDFLYIKPRAGSGEYVVVFDRVAVVNPADEIRWNMKVPFEPTLDPGLSWTAVELGPPLREGGVQGGRWVTDASSFSFVNRAYGTSHAKLHFKSVLHDGKELRRIGGDGFEWRDGYYRAYENTATRFLGDLGANSAGRYRVEIAPKALRPRENFLVLMQIGDADGLASMTPSVRLDDAGGRWAGVHVQDAANQWAALFVRDEADLARFGSVSYALGGSGACAHLLSGLKKGVDYKIYRGSALIAVVNSGADGVLRFDGDAGAGYTITDGGAANPPPARPKGLRLL